MWLWLFLGIGIGFIAGRIYGENRGWNLGLQLARGWESIALDWRMRWSVEMADTEHEKRTIREVRELERMHNGI
jgi:hypothetical protein